MSIYGSRSKAFTFALLLDDIDINTKSLLEEESAHIKLSKEECISTQASEDDDDDYDVSNDNNIIDIDKCGIQCKTKIHSKYIVDNTIPNQHQQSHSQVVKHQFTVSTPQLVTAIHTNTDDIKQRFSLFLCFPQIRKQFNQTIILDSNHLKTLLNKRHKHRLLNAFIVVTGCTIN